MLFYTHFKPGSLGPVNKRCGFPPLLATNPPLCWLYCLCGEQDHWTSPAETVYSATKSTNNFLYNLCFATGTSTNGGIKINWGWHRDKHAEQQPRLSWGYWPVLGESDHFLSQPGHEISALLLSAELFSVLGFSPTIVCDQCCQCHHALTLLARMSLHAAYPSTPASMVMLFQMWFSPLLCALKTWFYGLFLPSLSMPLELITEADLWYEVRSLRSNRSSSLRRGQFHICRLFWTAARAPKQLCWSGTFQHKHKKHCTSLAQGLKFRHRGSGFVEAGFNWETLQGHVTKQAAEVTLEFSAQHPGLKMLLPFCILILAAVCSGSYGTIFPGNSVDVPVLHTRYCTIAHYIFHPCFPDCYISLLPFCLYW